jgi:protein TonB
VQKISRLFEALTGEINHRPIVGLLTVLVVLLHLLAVVWLLQPTEPDNVTKPLKVMEVALISEPSPKAEIAPPAPPKKVPPKKKAVKPPVKKEPVINKKVERPKPQLVADEPSPVQPSPSDSVQKSETSVSSTASTNKSTKTGNGEAPTKAVSSGVVPLLRVKPKYPMRAASRHIEGWVKIEFTVSPTGTVTNANVVGASPSGIFDEAALDAIKKWKFKQKIVNGNAVTQRAVQVLKFTLLQ